MNTTQTVPADKVREIMEKVEKINRRAVKLGLEPFTLSFGPERVTEVLRDGDLAAMAVVDATLAGEWPVISGWEIAAKLDRSEGNMALRVPGSTVELPEGWRDRSDCEHCRTNRTRSYLYWLSSGDGVKLVGRTCLRDFLVQDPAALLFFADALQDFADDCDEMMKTGSSKFFGLWNILKASAMAIRLDGWTSRKVADERMYKSTADTVLFEFLLQTGANPRKFAPTDEDRKIAEETMEWMGTLGIDNESDYLANLARIHEAGGCSRRYVGYAVSAVAAYLREKGARLERERGAKSQHVGSVGDRLRDVPVTVLDCRLVETMGRFGDPFLVKLADDAGNRYSWFSSRNPFVSAGDRRLMTGSIKKHTEYKGVSETMLTRCKLEVL